MKRNNTQIMIAAIVVLCVIMGCAGVGIWLMTSRKSRDDKGKPKMTKKDKLKKPKYVKTTPVELTDLTVELEGLQKQIKKLKEDKVAIIKEDGALEEAHQKKINDIKSKGEIDIETIEDAISDAKMKIVELEEKLEKTVDAHDAMKESLEIEIKKSEEALDASNAQIAELNKNLKDAQAGATEATTGFQNASSKLKDAINAKNAATASLSKAQKELAESRSKTTQKIKEAQKAKLSEAARLQKSNEKLSKENAELRNQLDSLSTRLSETSKKTLDDLEDAIKVQKAKLDEKTSQKGNSGKEQ